jgi:hypothetical protein
MRRFAMDSTHEIKKLAEVYSVESQTITVFEPRTRVTITEIGGNGGVFFLCGGKEYFINADDEGGFDAVFSEIKGGSDEG